LVRYRPGHLSEADLTQADQRMGAIGGIKSLNQDNLFMIK